VRSASFAVLRYLAEGRFHSGTEIGRALGLSRSMLWRAVRELEAHGVSVLAVRGRGYRLAQPFDALDRGAIEHALGRHGALIHLDLIDECDSTSVLLAQRASAGAASGTVITCELQRAGRGRRGASWYSGLGTSLTFSLLWRFERGAAPIGGLPLAVGVACVRALESAGALGIGLKWPNDLLIGDAKLGGVLVEAASDASGPVVAIGVGINVRLPDQAHVAITRPLTDLAAAGASIPSRNLLLARLLAALAEALPVFAQQGFAAFRQEWLQRHAYQGHPVRVLAPARRTVEGVAAGVEEDGSLVVETAGGVERFHSADVSLRPAL
jgi:BirA family transcriptional regulator, biotin operon repressor / biotin---[acetyl-CoA-carboxylase] ligase